MNTLEAIEKRYSCRRYKKDEVWQEKLEKVLKAMRLAPSAHNAQDWKFIVVKDLEKRKKIAEAANQSFISQAPLIIVGVALNPDHILPSGNPAYLIDLAIALDHLTLAATDQGLATCWIGAFSQEEVKKILNIPAKCKVVALLPLGFAADTPGVKSRKPLSEIISYDSF